MDLDEAHWSDAHDTDAPTSLRGYAALSRDETAGSMLDPEHMHSEDAQDRQEQRSRSSSVYGAKQVRYRPARSPVETHYTKQNDDAVRHIGITEGPIVREHHTADDSDMQEARESMTMRRMEPRHSGNHQANLRYVEIEARSDFSGDYDSSWDSEVEPTRAHARLSKAAPRVPVQPQVPVPPLKLVRRKREPKTMREMADELDALQQENERLRSEQDHRPAPTQPAVLAYTSRILHQIDRNLYLDQPRWEPTDGNNVVLVASSPIRSVDYYLDQHPEIAFAIYKEYRLSPPADRSKIETKDGVFRVPEPSYEFISLIAPAMFDAIEAFIEKVPGFGDYFPDFNPHAPIQAPYLFMFYSEPFIDDIIPMLDPINRNLMNQLQAMIKKEYGYEYASAKLQAEKGLVARHTLKYLIRPGDVLVSGHHNSSQAYISLSWIEAPETVSEDPQYESWDYAGRKRIPRYGPLSKSTSGRKKITCTWAVPAWRWDYDGVFAKDYITLQIIMNIGYDEESCDITSLNTYPLKYAPEDVKKSLEKRGKRFWSLRLKRFISYARSEDEEPFNFDDRYMVDIRAYKKIYFDSKLARKRLRADPSLHMASDEPPSGDELLVFPPDIMAYDLQQKTWRKLYVDRIKDISWNKQAFKDLVAEPETKELIQALVTKQLTSKASTDFVAGKGNGLIMLLHGAPGTGKTFTAEGVAEFAEKPLLRVTCGDVGTQAEDVDVRLRASLDLGRMWDCVVLLDEADVFLEERDMKDLNRNALVSVFLRAIEYYEGILILTSNRVGTFDEAFRSRIQLALHYENLGLSQRRKIWRNFMERIHSLESESENTKADIEDILDHIDDLSREIMNGREIRNSITIARQLAQFRKEPLRYSHLKHVIGVGAKFEKYLKDLRLGMTDDDIKHDTGLRLSYTNREARPQ